MKKVTFRIATTLLALGISSAIVLALSYAGNQTKGPIDKALNLTGDVVQNVEQTLLVSGRPDLRKDKLEWFRPYQTNKQLLESPRKMLVGAFDNEARESFKSVISLEDSIKTTFPLIHIYKAWGSKPDEGFPASQVRNIFSLGSTPVITWEPWLADFSADDYPGLPAIDQRDRQGMKYIADGWYDAYVKQWAADAKKTGKPFFLRFGHEMNDAYRYPWGPQNNTAAEFIAAWRHVHDLFKKEGATNMIWVWCPHPAYEFESFYPGDDYVDYVGVSVLNYGSVALWSKWWSFADIFGPFYNKVAYHNKPVMITEFGSLAVGGDRTQWYTDALNNLPQKYPLLKSLLFFHFSKDNTTTQQTLDWYIKNDKKVTATVSKQIGAW
jgi:Glycosyl hydrolase family 26